MMKRNPSDALKISMRTRARLKNYCETRGIRQARFVEQAVIERLDREERIEDTREFKRWRHEEPQKVMLETYLKSRGTRKHAKAS